MGETGVKDDLKALGLCQRKAGLPILTFFSRDRGRCSVCFVVADLDQTTFRACSKHFESPGSQGAWLGCKASPGTVRWLAQQSWTPPPPRFAQKTKEHSPHALQLTKHISKHPVL